MNCKHCGKEVNARGRCYCSEQCSFWHKVDKGNRELSASSEVCWKWLSSVDNKGRPVYHFLRAPGAQLAHRRAYVYFFGICLTDDQILVRGCGNPVCVNPHHMVVESRLEHSRKSVRSPSSRPTKITEQDVLEIRQSKESVEALATKYHISKSHVGSVQKGRCWKKAGGEISPKGQGRIRSNAKLDAPMVAEIIDALKGKISRADIVKRFGVSESMVSLIANGKRWKQLRGTGMMSVLDLNYGDRR